jgi:hypothetical protein
MRVGDACKCYRAVPIARESKKTDIFRGNIYELWEFVVQPFSILEEIVLVVLVKFIPVFGGLGIIFHCI